MNTSMTRKLTILSAALLALSPMRAAISPEEIANTVVLDETGEKNLKIETVEAEEKDFEEIVLAVRGRSFEATLAHLGAAADAKSGTLEATFHIENPEGLLRPDMRAEFSIVLSKREGVMSVPRIALQGDVTSRTLYRRHYDNSLKHTFVRVPVQIGVMNARFVEITAGLVAGDEVVTTGAYSLAFAGKGSVSLKAALDAAHGHEHNEDGSEITPGQKAKDAAQKGDDGHKQGGSFSMLTIFSLASNGLLLVLLVVATLRKPRADEAAAAKPKRKPEEVQP
jgi:hypothetical protein